MYIVQTLLWLYPHLMILQETLIVVTADHSHGLTVNGYPHRGSNILGSVDEGAGMSFPTLMYSTGPGGLLATKTSSSARCAI